MQDSGCWSQWTGEGVCADTLPGSPKHTQRIQNHVALTLYSMCSTKKFPAQTAQVTPYVQQESGFEKCRGNDFSKRLMIWVPLFPELNIPKRNSPFSMAFLVLGHKHLGIVVLSHHQSLAEELPWAGSILETSMNSAGKREGAQAGSLQKPVWPTKVSLLHLYFTGVIITPQDAFLRTCVVSSLGSIGISHPSWVPSQVLVHP